MAIRSLIVATASQSADAALDKALADVEAFRWAFAALEGLLCNCGGTEAVPCLGWLASSGTDSGDCAVHVQKIAARS